MKADQHHTIVSPLQNAGEYIERAGKRWQEHRVSGRSGGTGGRCHQRPE